MEIPATGSRSARSTYPRWTHWAARGMRSPPRAGPQWRGVGPAHGRPTGRRGSIVGVMPQQVPTVTVPDLPAQLPQSTVLLDVREQDEWDAGHAPQAQHIPMSELAGRLGGAAGRPGGPGHLPQRRPLRARHRVPQRQRLGRPQRRRRHAVRGRPPAATSPATRASRRSYDQVGGHEPAQHRRGSRGAGCRISGRPPTASPRAGASRHWPGAGRRPSPGAYRRHEPGHRRAGPRGRRPRGGDDVGGGRRCRCWPRRGRSGATSCWCAAAAARCRTAWSPRRTRW